MPKISFGDLAQQLKKDMSPRRWKHSLCVSEMAEKYSTQHGWDPRKAKLAGLCHDCAREWPVGKWKAYVRRNKIEMEERNFVMRWAPVLLHGPVAADVLKKRGWIKDAVSLKAIATHTCGEAHMTLAQKILYAADFSSQDRDFPEAVKVRRVALRDLDKAVFLTTKFTIQFQIDAARPLYPGTIRLWNSLTK